jgi:hypothetical protein
MLRLGVDLRGSSVRLAESADEARLQALLESDPDYFKLILRTLKMCLIPSVAAAIAASIR